MSHFKAGCYKFKAMMNSKNKFEGKSLAFVTFESHLIDVSLNTLFYTRASIHVNNLLQGFEKK